MITLRRNKSSTSNNYI